MAKDMKYDLLHDGTPKYYLLYDGTTLARVEDPVLCRASVFQAANGWVRADDIAATVTGMGGEADVEDVSEAKAKELFPDAFR